MVSVNRFAVVLVWCWLLICAFTFMHQYNTRLQAKLKSKSDMSESRPNTSDAFQENASEVASGREPLIKTNSRVTDFERPQSSGARPDNLASGLRPGDRITQKFTKENPSGWFRYFNALCLRNRLGSDVQKIDALVSCLDSDTFLDVQPLLDGEHTVAQIETFLTQKFSKSLDQRLQELLNLPSLGDLKPSDFLSQARCAISALDMSDAVLCEILMMKLPHEVQTTLSIILGCPLDEFSRAADRAMRRFSSNQVDGQFLGVASSKIQQLEREVDSLKYKLNRNQSGSSSSYAYPRQSFSRPQYFDRYPHFRPRFYQSRSYNNGPSHGPSRAMLCFYHQRFGPNARKCVRPCSWNQGN